MPSSSLQPFIVWCASSRHFIVESNFQYSFTVFLGLQLANHIRSTIGPYPKNLVKSWYESLDLTEKSEITVLQLN